MPDETGRRAAFDVRLDSHPVISTWMPPIRFCGFETSLTLNRKKKFSFQVYFVEIEWPSFSFSCDEGKRHRKTSKHNFEKCSGMSSICWRSHWTRNKHYWWGSWIHFTFTRLHVYVNIIRVAAVKGLIKKNFDRISSLRFRSLNSSTWTIRQRGKLPRPTRIGNWDEKAL